MRFPIALIGLLALGACATDSAVPTTQDSDVQALEPATRNAPFSNILPIASPPAGILPIEPNFDDDAVEDFMAAEAIAADLTWVRFRSLGSTAMAMSPKVLQSPLGTQP